MRTGHKKYFMCYESDRIVCGSNEHTYGNANAISTCKGYIREVRKSNEPNPRNFRIYDSDGEIDPSTNFVPCVYQED